jgi:bifunctional non-homologous end joining protein LigD
MRRRWHVACWWPGVWRPIHDLRAMPAERAADRPPLALSNPDKVLFPKPGYTKRDLAEYYVAMSDVLLPFVRDRPLMLKSYPNGVDGRFFYRQDAPRHTPTWFATYTAPAESAGHDVDFLLANEARSLVWIANQAAIELHCWLARRDHPDQPDLLVFDLDPGADLDLGAAREVALLVRERLAEDRIEGLPKLSGKRGIHVLVALEPGQTFVQSHGYAERVAQDLARARPDLVTAEYRSKAARSGQVLIDYAQNARGKVTVAPYSVRPTADATVSMPLAWSELDRVPDRRDYTLASVPGLVAREGDRLGPAMARRHRLPG